MTGSEFIRKLTELTKAGKVKWHRRTNKGFLRYETEAGDVEVIASETVCFLKYHWETVHQAADDSAISLFNAISDTMPDIQTLFDNAIKELEK